MNKQDIDRLARVEQQLLDLGEQLTINELSEFPIASFEKLNALHSNSEISFGSNFNVLLLFI